VVAGWTKQQKKRKEKKLIFIPPETETPILEVNFKNYISHVLLVFSFRFLDLSYWQPKRSVGISRLMFSSENSSSSFNVEPRKREKDPIVINNLRHGHDLSLKNSIPSSDLLQIS
jgi:hypothetical protein